MTHDDAVWVLASILKLDPTQAHYAEEIIAVDDAERRMIQNLGSLVITPITEVLHS